MNYAVSEVLSESFATRYANSKGNLTRTSVDSKIKDYLLNPNYPIGKSKAEWFKKALGFT